MSQIQIPRWALAAVAVVLVFTMATAVHSAGWSQGFIMGLLVGNADGATLAPYLAHHAGYGWHHGGFGFFGGIFRFVFLLFFIALLAKFFGFMRWRHHHHGPWQHGPWWRHEQGAPHQSQQSNAQPQGDGPAAGNGEPAQNRPQPTSLTYV